MKMLRLFLIISICTGIIYPQLVTIVGQSLFSKQANGSLVTHNGKIVGSELLAQEFSEPQFFHARASASKFATIGSSATQSSVTKKEALKIVEERKKLNPHAGSDSWTASGSGLDPHITPTTAFAQVNRIAAARSLDPQHLRQLVNAFIESPTLGIWGQPRVNVLKLNLQLEEKVSNANTR